MAIKTNELEILNRINNMDEEELKNFREKNMLHNEKIAKRTVRNIISSFIKRSMDIIAGIIGVILLIPLTIIVWILNIVNKENGPIF